MPKTDVTFWLEGEPVAKARPRMTMSGHVYTPDKTTKAENAIRRGWQEHGGSMIHGPVSVSVVFMLKTPASWPMAKRMLAQEREIRPTKKPDVDNLVKTVMDALNGLAYYDDKHIVELSARKIYARNPGTVIRVREI